MTMLAGGLLAIAAVLVSLFVAAFCLFEGSLALLSLMAAAGRPQPKWLS